MDTTKSTATILSVAQPLIGTTVDVVIDRPLGSKHPKHGFLYKSNYGHVANITTPDGGELDAYYLGVGEPVTSGTGVVLAVIHREDEDNDKVVVVPPGVTLTDDEIHKAVAFQEQYYVTKIIRS